MCRPRPGREVPRSPEDVQRFYIIMMPTSRKAPVRLMTMGTTKRMPAQGERFWGAVLDTGHSVRPSEHMSLTCCPWPKPRPLCLLQHHKACLTRNREIVARSMRLSMAMTAAQQRSAGRATEGTAHVILA